MHGIARMDSIMIMDESRSGTAWCFTLDKAGKLAGQTGVIL